jgi:peptidyl-prolyl cis-trans isomerase SurA
MKFHRCVGAFAVLLFLPLVGSSQAPERVPAPPKEKKVVEEIVARVNNEIITLSDIARSKESLRQEVEEDCQSKNCSPGQRQAAYAEREKDLLRDLIDQSLLAQRGKDMGVNVEPDVIKRLDEIRIRNSLEDMETLQREVEKQGLSWEEFKSNIRNSILTQEVVNREVASNIFPDQEEVKQYYNEHQNDFVRPELVYLSELFVSTVGKPDSEIPALEARAKRLRERVMNGEDFEELAKRFSDGNTAKQGGELGGFKRGQLAPEIEEKVFKMKRKEMTEVIRTKTGFLVLRVDERYEAGLQPVERVEGEIMNRIRYEKIQPALRKYLAKLRAESYVVVKAGYTDSAAVASNPILETAPTPEGAKGKKGKKGKKAEDAAKEKKAENNKPKKAGE